MTRIPLRWKSSPVPFLRTLQWMKIDAAHPDHLKAATEEAGRNGFGRAFL